MICRCQNCGNEYQTDRPQRSRYCSRSCHSAALGRAKAGAADQNILKDEEFRPVAGFSGYDVSNMGRVRNRGRILLPRRHSSGYLRITLMKEGVRYEAYIHRLVLSAFTREPSDGEEADHIDRDRANNRLSNLRWLHSDGNRGRRVFARGASSGRAILDDAQVREIRSAINLGTTNSAIAARFGVARRTIADIRNGVTWRHLP